MNIGPIEIDWYTPTVSVDASSDGKGTPSVSINGAAYHPVIDTLEEFVSNPYDRTTVAGQSGVLAWVEMECASLAHRDGYYLLQSMSQSTDGVHIEAAESDDVDTLGHGPTAVVPFSISAIHLGDL